MADILTKIAAYKREEVSALKRDTSEAGLLQVASHQPAPAGFERALRAAPLPALIAEVKKASPSKGVIREDFDPIAITRAYEAGGATALSCLTDGPSFQGSTSIFRAVRSVTSLPMLRKDFLVDPIQVIEARAMGADAILVILSMTDDMLNRDLIQTAQDLGMDALIETHDAKEIDRALGLDATLIGINNRNLKTFHTTLDTFAAHAAKIPDTAVRVAESGIFTPADVERLITDGATALLVGESLMRQDDVEAATRKLIATS